MEWFRGLVFIGCALCGFGLDSPRPPSSPPSVEEVAASRSSFPMPGDIVEGDIVLDDNTAAMLRGGARNAMANVKKWPNGVVPYILDSSVDEYLKQQIDIGIAEYHKYTCLRFVKKSDQKDYIRIVKPASGCNSMVGVVGNGEQILNMGPGCEYVGLVLHEFGHAIGYFHEHNRPDRDNVIEVLWDNVQPSFKSAFRKYTFQEADTQGFPYDLTSIMHYENSAFGKAGFCKTTIVVKNDRSYEIRPVYERGVFSPQDIKKINKLYDCQMKGLPDVVMPGTNNPDPNACVCEDKHAECQSWKDRGECGNNNAWMSSNCPKSCRVCGEPPSDCKDEFPVACEEYAQRYECSYNPGWMLPNCPKSCGVCGTAVPPTLDPNACEDRNTGCPGWAQRGECSKNFDWMHQNCKKSCRVCGEPDSDCKDKYPQACSDWSSQGECQANPTWMGENCKKSCNKCTTSPTNPPGTLPPQTQPPSTLEPTTEPDDNCTVIPDTPEPPTQPPQTPPPPTQPPQTPPLPTQPPNTPPTGDCKDVYPTECPKYQSWGWCTKQDRLDYMKEVCSKTCKFCGSTVTQAPTQPPNTPPTGDCKDVYPTECPKYQSWGWCTKQDRLNYMKEVCSKTCKFCGSTVTQAPTQSPPTGDCKDVYPSECPKYQTWGWCTKQDRLDYMKEVCSKTCNFCGGSTGGGGGGGGGGNGDCKDVYPEYCPDYKSRGMCTDPNYVDYCKEVCKLTCGYC